MNSTQRYATDYWSAGFSLVPLKLDGSKQPALASWERFKAERPDLDQVQDWFARPAGIGVVLGAVSGGAECIDFDEPGLFSQVYDTLPTDLHKRLAVYETPGGWHVVYRCEETCSSRKIARTKEKKTRIESRGDKSYIVAEGSPFSVHKSGIPYCHYLGCRLETIGTITPEERRRLWQLCAAHDQTGEPTPSQKLGRELAEREYRERNPVDPASFKLASAYLAKMEPAIQGSNGSGACFRAASKLVGHFGLSEADALDLMVKEYNPRCKPPWSLAEIEHKVEDAMRKVGR